MDAITVNGQAEVDPARCIGCGLCFSACLDGAVALMRKSGQVPPADHTALLTQIVAEKGRAEQFMANASAR